MSKPVRAAISLQQLATKVGVSRKRVSNAIARGEIATERLGTDGRGRSVIIDAAGAESDLRSAVELTQKTATPEAADTTGIDFDRPETWPTSLAGLRAVREHHITRSAKLKADLSAGLLVASEKVRKDFFEASRTIRDQLQKIPDRVAHSLAAKLGIQDVDAVRNLLRHDIDRALEDLANTLASKVPQE